MVRLHLSPPHDDREVPPKICIGRCDIPNVLLEAIFVMMRDKYADLIFQIAREIIISKQHAILPRSIPVFNLTPGFRPIICAFAGLQYSRWRLAVGKLLACS